MNDFSYIAGLFDGDGSVTMMRKSKTDKLKSPIIEFTSTSPELVEYVKSICGGSIAKRKKRSEKHQPVYVLRLIHRQAINFCKNVIPYVKEKTKIARIQILLSNYDEITPKTGKYSDYQFQQKLLIEEQFFAIKQRGNRLL